VGQGNLTKRFLDLHLLDKSFDLQIGLAYGESDILQVMQLAIGTQVRNYFMLFVSHIPRGSCGCFDLQVAPRFEYGHTRA
jgi:hypothetical protein